MSQLNTGAVVGLGSAPETTYAVSPTAMWRTHQPTSGGIQDFYANDTQLARNVLSPNMMREAGEIVDRDCAPKMVHELTKEWADHWAAGSLLSLEKWNGGTGTGRFAVTPTAIGVVALTAVAAGAYTVASGGALQAGTLVFARGFTNAANNGLQVVAAASTGISIKVTAAVLEASPPANATLEVVGFQFAAADLVATTTGWTSTAADFTTMGLQQWEYVWVGGGTAAAPGAFGFTGGGYRGFARLNTIAAHAVTLDQTLTAQVGDAGAGKTVQVFFGSFIRNVAKTSADRSEQSFNLELSVPGLDSGGATDFCYASGCLPAQIDLDWQEGKFVMTTTTFIGSTVSTYATARSTGASSAPTPIATGVFNVATETPRLRILDTSGNVLCQDMDSFKITIKPNLKGQKQIGNLGAKRVLPGEFDVDISFKGFLLQPDLVNARPLNTNIVFELGIRNNDGGMFISCPQGKFQGGSPDFPQNDAITIAGTFMAHRDPVTNFEISITKFPYLPAS